MSEHFLQSRDDDADPSEREPRPEPGERRGAARDAPHDDPRQSEAQYDERLGGQLLQLGREPTDGAEGEEHGWAGAGAHDRHGVPRHLREVQTQVVVSAADGLADVVGNDVGEKRRGRRRDYDNDTGPVGDALRGGRDDRGEHEDIAVDVGAYATAHALYG